MTTAQSSLFDDYFDALVRGDPVAATDLVMDLLEAGSSLSEIFRDWRWPAIPCRLSTGASGWRLVPPSVVTGTVRPLPVAVQE